MPIGETKIQTPELPLNSLFIRKTSALSSVIDSFIKTKSENDLHDVRVSARRLETLFGDFGHLFPGGEYREYFLITRKLIKLFGRSRELDVCIEMTREYTGMIKLKDSFITGFLENLEDSAKSEKHKIPESKPISDFTDIAGEMNDYFSASEILPFQKNPELLFGNVIMKQFYSIVSLSDKILLGSGSKELLHSIRIKSKPLRYNIEFASDLIDSGIKKKCSAVRDFVESAGIIHDIDVLIQRAGKYMKKRGLPAAAGKQSAARFLRYLAFRRKNEFEKLVKIINKIKSREFRNELYSLLFKRNV
ncbi:MAG: CHAD domain-containing protein [Bacteroidetes bacterium]|nr:CHAD domain-containing protein [Bacteroidota bacterium]